MPNKPAGKTAASTGPRKDPDVVVFSRDEATRKGDSDKGDEQE